MHTRIPRLLLTLAVAIAVGAGAAACGSEPAGQSGTAPTQAVNAGTGQVPVAAFADAIARPGTVVVDVRTPEEFRSGHLAGAVNLDLQAPDFGARIAGLDKAAQYAVYCRSGNRSAAAATQMRAAGLHVTDLAGGIVAWTGAGRPTTTA